MPAWRTASAVVIVVAIVATISCRRTRPVVRVDAAPVVLRTKASVAGGEVRDEVEPNDIEPQVIELSGAQPGAVIRGTVANNERDRFRVRLAELSRSPDDAAPAQTAPFRLRAEIKADDDVTLAVMAPVSLMTLKGRAGGFANLGFGTKEDVQFEVVGMGTDARASFGYTLLLRGSRQGAGDEREPNDGTERATNLGAFSPLGDPLLAAGFVGWPGDVDVFSFVPKPGAALDIRVTQASAPVGVEVQDAQGRRMGGARPPKKAGQDTSLRVSLGMDAAATDRIFVVVRGQKPDLDHPYVLRIEPARDGHR